MKREPLWSKNLRALDHRLIWFLLSKQVVENGAPTGRVAAGWRTDALRELETHRPLLWAAEKRLKEAGVIRAASHSQEVIIDGGAFG